MKQNKLNLIDSRSQLVKEATEAWLIHLNKTHGLSENTVKNYKRDMERFFNFAAKHKARKIIPEDLENFKYEKGVSCPYCFYKTNDFKKNNFRERQKQILLSFKKGEKHLKHF